MNLAICDDEFIYLDDLHRKCNANISIDSISLFQHPKELLSALAKGSSFHVILMDIDYNGDHTGIEYMEYITKKYANIPVIYVTNYTDRFVEQIFLKNANIIGFIKKPVQDSVLNALLQKCQNFLLEKKENTITLSLGKGSQHTVSLAEITYLEIADHSTRIHTLQENFLVHEKLESILARLSPNFERIHKSFAVNMDFVDKIHNQIVEIRTPESKELPISRTYRSVFKGRYIAYMQSKL